MAIAVDVAANSADRLVLDGFEFDRGG